MPITTMAVHVEAAEMATLEARLALPLALARTHEAHVCALVFRTNVLGETGEPEGAEEAAFAGRVQGLLDGAGVRGDVRGRSSFAYGVGEVFADQMRVSDIGLMAFPAGAAAGAQFVAAGGIFSSGARSFFTPTGRRPAVHASRSLGTPRLPQCGRFTARCRSFAKQTPWQWSASRTIRNSAAGSRAPN